MEEAWLLNDKDYLNFVNIYNIKDTKMQKIQKTILKEAQEYAHKVIAALNESVT